MAQEKEFLEDDLYGDEDEDTQKDKFLTFILGNEEYGIEIRYVLEVVGMQHISEVPDMPSFIKGVINLRGQVIPVMDVRLRFRMEPREYDDRTCVIVVHVQDTSIGLVVDEVNEVLDIPEKQVEPPPRVSRKTGSRFIQGLGKVGEQVRILLNVEKMLYDEEWDQLVSATG